MKLDQGVIDHVSAAFRANSPVFSELCLGGLIPEGADVDFNPNQAVILASRIPDISIRLDYWRKQITETLEGRE